MYASSNNWKEDSFPTQGRNVLDRKDRIKIDRSEIKEVVKQVVMAVPFKAQARGS